MRSPPASPVAQLRPGDDGAPDDPDEFVRLWRGFMTARVTLGLVLVLLQSSLYALGQLHHPWLVVVCAVYLFAALVTRLTGRPSRLGRTLNLRWLSTIGVDVVAFAVLQYMQGQSGINYAPLLALPVLLAAVLGSLPLALATAAGATLLLLAQAGLSALGNDQDPTSMFAQSALTGVGYFVIAALASQMSARLASEEQRSRRSQLAARVQREVNALVIESLDDGVLVADARSMVWAANPAARSLLGRQQIVARTPFALTAEPGWRELHELNQRSFRANQAQHATLVLNPAGAAHQLLHALTRMAAIDVEETESLCVIFLQDQRELEARMRTEKLVSMGRMSTAVAHEIRNPLAAIVQANALLDEDLDDPKLRRLTAMVRQNATRLERIVDDILNVSRIQSRVDSTRLDQVLLNQAVRAICLDWAVHAGRDDLLKVDLCQTDQTVSFDAEHLRRVLVNLLDNACRYASARRDAVWVSTTRSETGLAVLGVWSDGPPMEQSVRRHLFEPFFSSESRSTGLGLYICRELCDGHGALIAFERTHRVFDGERVDGNEFLIRFAATARGHAGTGASAKIAATPWQHERP